MVELATGGAVGDDVPGREDGGEVKPLGLGSGTIKEDG